MKYRHFKYLGATMVANGGVEFDAGSWMNEVCILPSDLKKGAVWKNNCSWRSVCWL